MNPVKLYTRKFCGYCSAAKRLLDQKGINYEEVDATLSRELRQEMMHRSGRSTFPQIFIGETHIGGFDDMFALERQGKLDPILSGEAA